MSKAARKIKRNEEMKERKVRDVSEAEIEAEYGKRSTFGKFVQDLDIFKWMDLNIINTLIVVAMFTFTTLVVESYMDTVTTVLSSAILSHGIVTNILFVTFFTFIKKKEGAEKVDTNRLIYRYLMFGICFAIIGAISVLFI